MNFLYKREWSTPKEIIDSLREKYRLPNESKEVSREEAERTKFQKCRVCGSEDFQVKIVIDKVSKKEESKLCCAKCGEPVTAIGGEIVQ